MDELAALDVTIRRLTQEMPLEGHSEPFWAVFWGLSIPTMPDVKKPSVEGFGVYRFPESIRRIKARQA